MSNRQEVENEPGRAPKAVRIRLLGRFEVSVGSRVIREDAWRLRKAANLVKLLALSPDHRLHREQAAELLWPGQDSKAASNSLYHTLHVARKVLDLGSDAASSLRLRDEWLTLCPGEGLWVDVRAFEEAARAAIRGAEPEAYRAALDLCAGDLLPGNRYEDWAEERREALRMTRLSLLVEMAALREQRGEIGAAIEALREATAEDPTHQEACVGLMRLYAATGRRSRALEEYGRLRQALGTEPDARTRRASEEVLAGDLPIAEPLANPPLAGQSRHNLPRSLTSFVGRERETEEVKRLLSTTPLLTITGSGGSGKTRLALKVAREVASAHPGGAWLVELASLSDGTLLSQSVARVLTVREQPERPLPDTLLDALREKELLLVLDNCEHLVDPCARFAEKLLESCPGLKVLATSQETLGVAGEVVWRVPPLPVPAPGEGLAVEGLARCESVRLFVERARQRDPAFALTQGNAHAVAEICRKLDGIPLAIELAAARVRMLPAGEIASRLDDPLKLLRGGARTATPRQRTLRDALDWSYGLLDEPEKRLFDRLSVFVGGFSLQAAEAVTAEEDGETLELLSGLVDKSLVVPEAGARAGHARYRMLEFVRQYAREKLEENAGETPVVPGEADEARRRHALWCLKLAEEAEVGLRGPAQRGWLERLEREHPNLRAALSWALGGGDAALGLKLAAGLWPFWETHGHLVEGRRWLKKALAGSIPEQIPGVRAKALNGAGYMALFQGDYEESKDLLEEGLRLHRELGDDEGVAYSLTNLGFVAMFGMRDDLPVGDLLEEAMVLKDRIRDHHILGNLLIFAGMMLETHGEARREMPLHEESLALLREARDARGMSMCLTSLGFTLLKRGDHAGATRLLRENLLISRGLDKKYCIAYSFFGMAGVALETGRPARAARLWAASESVREAAGIELSPLARTALGYDDRLASAKARLGEVAFERAWAEGRNLAQDEAVEYALDEPSTAPETPDDSLLTRREEEVAALLAQGLSNRHISEELGISERTVTTHVGRILKKLGFRSRSRLVAARADERRPV